MDATASDAPWTSAAPSPSSWALVSVAAYQAQLPRTPEARAAVAAFPQGTVEWKQARFGMLTASRLYRVSGMGGPAAQMAELRDVTWPDMPRFFGSRHTAYGTAYEPVAGDVYLRDRHFRVPHPAYRDGRCEARAVGLLVHKDHPWLGASPDLVVREAVGARGNPGDAPPVHNAHHLFDPYVVEYPDGVHAFQETVPAAPVVTFGREWCRPAEGATQEGCVEIKCVAAAVKQFYSAQSAYARFGTKPEYYVQMQAQMEVGGWAWCDFVVYLPTATQVTRFYRDTTFWGSELFPKVDAFYREKMLPALHLRASGVLVPGTLTIRPDAVVPAACPCTTLLQDADEDAETVIAVEDLCLPEHLSFLPALAARATA